MSICFELIADWILLVDKCSSSLLTDTSTINNANTFADAYQFF